MNASNDEDIEKNENEKGMAGLMYSGRLVFSRLLLMGNTQSRDEKMREGCRGAKTRLSCAKIIIILNHEMS